MDRKTNYVSAQPMKETLDDEIHHRAEVFLKEAELQLSIVLLLILFNITYCLVMLSTSCGHNAV